MAHLTDPARRRGRMPVRHARRACRRRRWRALLAPSLIAAAVAGCRTETSRPATTVRISRSMVALAGDGSHRTAARGGAHARWLRWENAVVPALVVDGDHELAVRVDDLGVTTLRGRFGLLGVERNPPPAGADEEPDSVTFRVLASAAPGSPGTALFEGRAGERSDAVARFAVDLPRGAGPLWITLQTRFAAPVGGRQVAWLDPVLEGRRALTGAGLGQPWNVIVVTLDTTRRDVLGPYGGTARTPALERLAGRAAIFDNAYAVAFGTTPSHASLFTGSHAREHGVYDNDSILAASHTTLAEVLRDHGYATAAFVGARPVGHGLGFAQGFDHFDDLFLEGLDSSLAYFARHERRADLTLSRFLGWLAREPPRPFFAWLHFFDPHQPYLPLLPPPPERSPLAARAERLFVDDLGRPAYLEAARLLRDQPEMLAPVAALARRRYAAEVEQVDVVLGRLLDELERRGLERHTLLVVLADHGENFLEHLPVLAFNHATLRDAVARVPLIVAVPGGGAAGERRASLVATCDIAPTVLDLLGVAVPPAWSGRSFRPLLQSGGERPFRRHLVLEGAYRHEVGVRTERWLYRQVTADHRADAAVLAYLGLSAEQPFEVYDMAGDSGPTHPVEPPSCPALPSLRGQVERFLSGRASPAAAALDSPAHAEALRALGYLR